MNWTHITITSLLPSPHNDDASRLAFMLYASRQWPTILDNGTCLPYKLPHSPADIISFATNNMKAHKAKKMGIGRAGRDIRGPITVMQLVCLY